MTIYNDNANNKYLGNCIWSNHNPIYRQDFHLAGLEKTADIQALRNSVQGLYQDLSYLPEGSVIDGYWGVTASLNPPISTHYELPNGATVANGGTTANLALDGIWTGRSWNGTGTEGAKTPIPIQDIFSFPTGANISSNVVIGASANHTAILEFNYKYPDAGYSYRFSYVGVIQDINTGFDYYDSTPLTQTVVGGCSSTSVVATGSMDILPLQLSHFIANATESVLSTGRAVYPIVCDNAETPTAQWATDFYVFDNNSDIGDPCMGKLPGLLLAQGNYTLLKPVKITTVSTGSVWFLPVATFTGKTVLMRVHSTMT